ncbi:nitrate reductase subunit alpha [Paenibacillus larvae]|uniref:nitrate reductase (quinone) n=1 Tax=Paenibacillus larvae TaxID=1464 RepID=A0AAP5JT05_9BACL|nr:nitrate reductase subunit alpha [Paenibacillus larvae]AQR78807.1 nitrate reductase subunit alpha [Paenibacillus larvae subsp. larvae]AVF24148.1 nitrate reductase alpha chain NarG [Paenibacillus larvae subsp. larvae]ETK28986.1 nitrate reductase alpha chain NarG [Paenibacillus larvae subsp. larvae DSM 25719]MCY7478511.1 nitrate reductase subunit alpha [Paenibacillus larvae]MCY7488534.1 nitrate reductase subunit alpha [Paenibacillus larvae]
MTKKRRPLLDKLRYFTKRERYSEDWSEVSPYDRSWEDMYRSRWQHDKVVRSTHGVNCTGSCSWKIFVKNGIVTWENQQTDYPSCGPDMPEFEPRGCPRGASFSWYLYSPLRVKYPYVRGVLLDMWREALKENGDPVKAWASIVEDPAKSKRYKSARGKGGMVRASWEEVTRIVSASLIYTIKKDGPDRIFGFSPIPAMSMISYAAGSRFLSLLGSPLLSFYDWYADLPPASPQVWGDQTDVPESSDWFNSGYMLVWGSNLPMTRTPDAHFMTEARYRGTKVVSISPDYAEYVKFADQWMSVKPGTDGALAMAMGHVILREFYVDNPTEYFIQYAKAYTDFPFLVTLDEKESGFVPGRFLLAGDLGIETNHADWKTVLFDENQQRFAVPNGTIGSRWGEEGTWNLHMTDIRTGEELNPRLTMLGMEDEQVEILLPYFDDKGREVLRRNVPVKKVVQDGRTLYVTTVYDLMLANYGIDRSQNEIGFEDVAPYTPAWQEAITGVDRETVMQIAREFAQNAADTKGRSMIVMGAGINHWYNSDTIYRAILNLVLMTGCQGVNGGGWAYYVGQEKLRPAEGWATVAFARDWSMPPRQQNGTSYFYFATDQWRYEETPVDQLVSPLADKARYSHYADYNVLAARLGWLPSYPQFDRNSLSLYEEAKRNGAKTPEQVADYVAGQLQNRRMKFAVEDPDAKPNHPKVMFVWRANLISSSGKGHEYFLKHLLGARNGLLNHDRKGFRPEEIEWHDKAPEGKLDLMVNLEFRMSGTALYSDIVLPAATWYEKSDLSSTDMHPFVHPFNPAVGPQWESKSDWEIFKTLAQSFSELAEIHFDGPQTDVVTVPLQHDTPDELAQPFGKIKDWSKGETEAIPGKTMPKIALVERDYAKVYEKMTALGPLVKEKPYGIHGMSWSAAEEYEKLKKKVGTVKRPGLSEGYPDLSTDRHMAEAILTLSTTTNGRMSVKAWEALERKTNLKLKDLAEDRIEECFTFEEITNQPKTVITSPAFSGSEQGGRRYSPFTTNVERLVPWRTLTGRQHFYIDHEMMMEFGENMAVFKPTLKHTPFHANSKRPEAKGKEVTLNYLTPHNKWSIHSMYYDNLTMLTLFRGGPTVWMNKDDAVEADIEDNDWIECFNQNGVVVARAVVTHRIPRGMAFMYHAQDRTINVPGTKMTDTRGGTHNSPTRIHVKPTHMIGGYAQLSYGFNYYGPTGNQRDLNVIIRKLEEVDWLED